MHIFIIVFLAFNGETLGELFDIVDPAVCGKADQRKTHASFFNSLNLNCDNCKQSLKAQVTSRDYLNCECGSLYRMTGLTTSIACSICPPGLEQARTDPTRCVQKLKTCTYDAKTVIYTERSLNGTFLGVEECLPCFDGTKPNDEKTRCIPCPEVYPINWRQQKSCTCTKESVLGAYCFQNKLLVSTLPRSSSLSVAYVDPKTKTHATSSWYFSQYLLPMYVLCKNFNNITACQSLANMCVLNLYNGHNAKTLDSSCALHNDIPNDRQPKIIETKTASNVLEDKTIDAQFTFSSGRGTSKILLKAAKFHLDGRFLAWVTVTGDLVQFCRHQHDYLNSPFLFGVDYKYSCMLDSREFWNEPQDNAFYELYLTFTKDGAEKLYPIPVLIENFGDNGKSATDSWTFVRRFFFVDTESFKNAADATPKYIRVATKLSLHVQMQKESREGRIYPPYLRVFYSSLSESEHYSGSKLIEFLFEVSYAMDITDSNRTFIIVLLVLTCTLALLYAVIRSIAWSTRSGDQQFFSCPMIGRFIIYLCGMAGAVFLVVSFAFAMWQLMFFKQQDIVYLLLPKGDQDNLLLTMICVAFAFRSLHLLYMIWRQVNVDIFLIDWEERKPNEKPENSPTGWRRIFVINEWNEIQSTRRINKYGQLFAVLFILEILGLKYCTTKDPFCRTSEDSSMFVAEQSKLLRFAMSTLVYMLVALAQWIFIVFIYERFFGDSLFNFVDLCHQCNIGVIILAEQHFGYLIYGKSSSGNADVSYGRIKSNLEPKDASGMRPRGLGGSDQTTFEILTPHELRNLIWSAELQMGDPMDALERKNERLKRFLADSLTINYGEPGASKVTYTIRRKKLYETILGIERRQLLPGAPQPNESNERLVGVFYEDDGRGFDAVLFSGHERSLIIFEVLLFSIVDMISQSYVLSAIVTYIVSHEVLSRLRDWMGERNIAHKTGVDDKFLL